MAVAGIPATCVGSGWAVGEGPAMPVPGTVSVCEASAEGLAVSEGAAVEEGNGVKD